MIIGELILKMNRNNKLKQKIKKQSKKQKIKLLKKKPLNSAREFIFRNIKKLKKMCILPF